MSAANNNEARELALLHDPVVHDERLNEIRQKLGFIIDMENVIFKGNKLLPGAKELVQFLEENNKKYFFLTNNSAQIPRELQYKFSVLGLAVGEEHFFTSGQATALFLQSQMPDGDSVYVIGEAGLCQELYSKGFIMNDHNPDYVVLGETVNYNFEKITKAVQLVQDGAKLIATNLDLRAVDHKGLKVPSTGAFAACIELVTQTKAFSCGKPSALIMRYAQRVLGLSRSQTCIVGDQMETDIAAGISSEIGSVLVLSGISEMDDLKQSSYGPFVMLDGIHEIPTGGQNYKVSIEDLDEAERRVSLFSSVYESTFGLDTVLYLTSLL